MNKNEERNNKTWVVITFIVIAFVLGLLMAFVTGEPIHYYKFL